MHLRSGASQQHLDLGAEDATASTGMATDLSDDDVVAEVEGLLDWAELTATGDMAELDDTPHWQAWRAVSVGPGECVGAANCSFSEECWSEQARTAAEHADVVIVNAHLYGAHIQTGRTLLPHHTRLVIDEAHEFEDSIVGSLSVELTEGRLANLARVHGRCVASDDTDGPKDKVGTSLRSAGQMLESTLTGMTADAAGPATQVRLREGLGSDLTAVVSTAVAAADRALNSLRRAAKHAGQGPARHRIDRAVRVAEGVLGDAQSLLGALEPGSVCWIETARSGRHALRLTRIDVAATLAVRAWEDSGLTVVCCSATLDRGTAERLGLDAEYLAVDSPFDFREQAVLYVPKLARPNHPDWPEQVAAVVAHLIERLDGSNARAVHLEPHAARHRRDGVATCALTRPSSPRARRPTRCSSDGSSMRSTPACSRPPASGPACRVPAPPARRWCWTRSPSRSPRTRSSRPVPSWSATLERSRRCRSLPLGCSSPRASAGSSAPRRTVVW